MWKISCSFIYFSIPFEMLNTREKNVGNAKRNSSYFNMEYTSNCLLKEYNNGTHFRGYLCYRRWTFQGEVVSRPFCWKRRQCFRSRRLHQREKYQLIWIAFLNNQNCIVPKPLDFTFCSTVCLILFWLLPWMRFVAV